MARPQQNDSGGLILGGLFGALAGGPQGALIGGLTGALLTSNKLPLEAAIILVANERGFEVSAKHWVTKRRLQIGLRKNRGPIVVVDLEAPANLVTRDAVEDVLYDEFVKRLGNG